MPSTDEHTAEEHTADTNHQAVTAQTLTRRFWWAGIPLVIILIAAGYWLVRHRQTRLAIRATEHRIDATWATPNTVAQEDPRTNELLEHSHGINTPDPGIVIAPGVNKENEDDKK